MESSAGEFKIFSNGWLRSLSLHAIHKHQRNAFLIHRQFLSRYSYEVRDADPDVPQPYRANVTHLIPIPPANQALPTLTNGLRVLALYPKTTTFYKAEVVPVKSGVQVPHGWVRLKFEGEDEVEREVDVERRYVLPDPGK